MARPGMKSGATPPISLRSTCEVANESMSLLRRTAPMKEIESDSILAVRRLEAGHPKQGLESQPQQYVAARQDPRVGERARRLRSPFFAQRMVLARDHRDGVGGEGHGLQSSRAAIRQGRHDKVEITGPQRLVRLRLKPPSTWKLSPGYCALNSATMRGNARLSHDGPAPILSTPTAPRPSARTSPRASSSWTSSRPAWRSKACPCSVRATPRGSLTKRAQSSEASSRRTAFVRPGCVMPRALAAALKLPWRATALK